MCVLQFSVLHHKYDWLTSAREKHTLNLSSVHCLTFWTSVTWNGLSSLFSTESGKGVEEMRHYSPWNSRNMSKGVVLRVEWIEVTIQFLWLSSISRWRVSVCVCWGTFPLSLFICGGRPCRKDEQVAATLLHCTCRFVSCRTDSEKIKTASIIYQNIFFVCTLYLFNSFPLCPLLSGCCWLCKSPPVWRSPPAATDLRTGERAR